MSSSWLCKFYLSRARAQQASKRKIKFTQPRTRYILKWEEEDEHNDEEGEERHKDKGNESFFDKMN